uniref:Uncharacterized protein n=1 Tax=Dulem virus 206 TaxID=3145683 RepID=A0AAU8B5J5_9VIRU
MSMKYLRTLKGREWTDEEGNLYIAMKIPNSEFYDVFKYTGNAKYNGYMWCCTEIWINICKTYGGIDQKSDTIKRRKEAR